MESCVPPGGSVLTDCSQGASGNLTAAVAPWASQGLLPLLAGVCLQVLGVLPASRLDDTIRVAASMMLCAGEGLW